MKRKLLRFAELDALPNVYQLTAHDLRQSGAEPNPAAAPWHPLQGNVVLELGCGRGEYTVGLAERHPENTYIGVDIKGARLWAGAKYAYTQGVQNAFFLRTQIELIPCFFGAGEVQSLWITFPDPQMKKATKRLTSSYFLQRYAQILSPQGVIHLKTDSPFLYAYTRRLLHCNALPVYADTPDLYAAGADPQAPLLADARALQTHYEQQWLERGMTIKYLAFGLGATGDTPLTLTEPSDGDIPRDTYRSYKR